VVVAVIAGVPPGGGRVTGMAVDRLTP